MKVFMFLSVVATAAFADVQIGDQVWQSKNVDNNLKVTVTAGGEPFYGLDYSAYNLYTFDNAVKACPSGYRLPSEDDWNILLDYVDNHRAKGTISQNLMAGQWTYNGECCDYENDNPDDCAHDPMVVKGLDAFGFSALGGSIASTGFMLGEGPCEANEANFWISSRKVVTFATDLSTPVLRRGNEHVVAGVRCIKGGTAEERYIEITSNALNKEYASNKFRADSKYRGKMLKVSGEIYKIDQDDRGDVYVLLESDIILRHAKCVLKPNEYSKAYDLDKGQKITIVGIGGGEEMLDVYVTDCEIK